MQHTGWSNTRCSSCEIAWRDEVRFPCGYLYCCSHWISKSMSGLHPYCHHWGVRLSMVHVLSASPFQINTVCKIRARSGRFKQANKCTHTLVQWRSGLWNWNSKVESFHSYSYANESIQFLYNYSQVTFQLNS